MTKRLGHVGKCRYRAVLTKASEKGGEEESRSDR